MWALGTRKKVQLNAQVGQAWTTQDVACFKNPRSGVGACALLTRTLLSLQPGPVGAGPGQLQRLLLLWDGEFPVPYISGEIGRHELAR